MNPLPRLMLGTAPMGGLFEPVSDDAAARTLEAAWQAGIRAFDTAPHYGAGLSEQRLGAFLASKPRSEYLLSTKVGRLLVPAQGPVEGAENFYGTPPLTRVWDFTADGARRSLEQSLERLGLDRIDIALIHDPDDHAQEALDGAYPALADLRSQGVIDAIGVGMNQPELPEWFVQNADLDCILIAGRYTLLDQSAATSLLPACLDREVAVLAGGVFNSGILADPQPGKTYDYRPASAELVGRARAIADLCGEYGVPIAAAALHFTLAHPAISTAVVGARTPAEITEDAGYLGIEVPPALLGALAIV
jgi:D-threo-aldose 1-dehydrogenase